LASGRLLPGVQNIQCATAGNLVDEPRMLCLHIKESGTSGKKLIVADTFECEVLDDTSLAVNARDALERVCSGKGLDSRPGITARNSWITSMR